MSSKPILDLAATASAFVSSTALAATEAPECVHGTVAAATADSVTVDACADKPVKVALNGNTSHLKVEKSNLNKIGKGIYVAAATKNIGGTQVAPEVVIFPPPMRGAAQGHYAWDKIPDTTLSGGAPTSRSMTSGNVSAVSTTAASVNSTMTDRARWNRTRRDASHPQRNAQGVQNVSAILS